MEIEGDRISALDTDELVLQSLGQQQRGAESGVDMKPEPLIGAEFSQPGQIVDGADIDAAGGADHEEGRPAGGAIGA